MTSQTEVRITWDDLERLPPDGMRHEIIRGEHVVNATPNLKHQFVSRNLEFILHAFVRAHRLGEVLDSPVGVVFPNGEVFDPDIVFVSNEHRARLGEKRIEGAPDLVVEILSESTRRTDEITKRATYEEFGVTEYWIIDTYAESVKVYRRSDSGAFAHSVLVTAAEDRTLTTPLLPGLTIDLAEVFDG
jgi:Uma2 family endonuclease